MQTTKRETVNMKILLGMSMSGCKKSFLDSPSLQHGLQLYNFPSWSFTSRVCVDAVFKNIHIGNYGITFISFFFKKSNTIWQASTKFPYCLHLLSGYPTVDCSLVVMTTSCFWILLSMTVFVSKSVCACMCLCTHMCEYTVKVNICMHVCVSACVPVWVHACKREIFLRARNVWVLGSMSVSACVHVHMSPCVFVSVCMHVSVYLRVRVCVHVCVCRMFPCILSSLIFFLLPALVNYQPCH